MAVKDKFFDEYIKHKNKSEQLEFLSKSTYLEEVAPPFIVKNITIIIILIFSSMIIWGSLYEVSELVKGTGKVIPSGNIRSIQHLEGGIVKFIHTEEGSLVTKGSPLLTIENTQILAEYEKMLERKKLLSSQIRRLEILLYGTTKQESETNNNQDNEILSSMKESFSKEKNIIKKQLLQKKDELSVLIDRKKNAYKSYLNSKKRYNHTRKLYKNGFANKTSLLSSESEKIKLWSSYSQLKESEKQLENAVVEFENRLSSLEITSREKNLKELEDLNHKFVENNKNLKKINDQISRLNIYAPVKGIVNNLKVNTIGGIISPGSHIMDIVPTSEKLVIELDIATEDIGHIEIAQNVVIKVTSYDFSKFGAINGKIIHISPTTFTEANKSPFYKVKIDLEKDYVGDNPDQFKIIPGMIVEGNVKAGKKSILAYLLRPIHRSVSTALSEK